MINIVMLVKDRPRLTEQAIDSLLKHTDRKAFTLTVLDDGSQLRTRGVLGMMLAGLENGVTVRIGRGKGIVGLARNLGIRASELYWGRGSMLYLSDNDVYFRPGWLDKLLAAWPKAYEVRYRILGGYNHPYQRVAGIETGTPAPTVQYSHGEIREYYAVGGLSWLLDWETWDRFGVLEAHAVGVAKSEDWEYCQRIRKAGGKVGAVWPHVVYNTGLTGADGKPCVGQEAMERVKGVVME